MLIGDNATGKSAVLDALSILIGSYLLDFKSATKRSIKSAEVREKTIRLGGVETLELQFPVALSCSAIVYDVHSETVMQWSRELQNANKKTSRSNAREIIKRGRDDAKKVQNAEDAILPLMTYYGTGRLWHKKKEGIVEVATGLSVAQNALSEKTMRLAGLNRKVDTARASDRRC